MAITVDASSQFSATAATTVDVTRPASFTADSLGLVMVGSDNNTFDDPPFSISGTGWVEVAKIQTGSDDRVARVWRQFNPGDATSTVTLAPATGPNTDDMGAHYLRVEGVDSTTPVDAVGTAQTGATGGGGNATVTSTVTTVTDGALAVCLFVFDGADGGTPITFGSAGVGANGWGSLTNAQSGGGGAGVTVAYCTKAMPTAGDAGQVELDVPANDGWAAIMFALRPAAGGGPIEGTVSATYGGTVTATGLRTALGTAQGLYGGSVSATGTRVALGTAQGLYGGTTTATGTVGGAGTGTGTAIYGGQTTATGTRTALGTATANYGGSVAGDGLRIVLGTATGAYGGTTTGTGTIPSNAVTGTATVAYGGATAATGLRIAVGTGAIALGGQTSSTGTRTRTGTATATCGYQAVVLVDEETRLAVPHRAAIVQARHRAAIVQSRHRATVLRSL